MMGAPQMTAPQLAGAALIEAIRRRWAAEGFPLRDGVSSDELEQFEAHHQVCLPPDLRLYFASVDGLDGGWMDEDGFTFLPLNKVKSIPEVFGENPAAISRMPWLTRSYVFADWLISSWVYAIDLSQSSTAGPVICFGGYDWHRIAAENFSDFLGTYLEAPLRLL
jgi:hypothetical protein